MVLEVQESNTFAKLTKEQLNCKLAFINNYINASNASTGSKYDSNSNVGKKSLLALLVELNKDINIQTNRSLTYKKLVELYSKEVADQYIKDLEEHIIYTGDETSILPYCCSISLYPLLLEGLKTLGSDSTPPKHITSFIGNLVNLTYLVSGHVSGAVATVEALLYIDYFCKKDYGENYLKTNKKELEQDLQEWIHALNVPLGRMGQTCFSNISLYDKYYFEGMFGNFVFPDGTKPNYTSLEKLQRFFMKWFNKEREKAVLTFPVVTANALHDNNDFLDLDFKDFVCDMYSKGNAFFLYTSDDADSTASCCRVRNDIKGQRKEFSYSTGAGGVNTGSLRICSLNLPMLYKTTKIEEDILNLVYNKTKDIVKYLKGHKKYLKEFLDADLLPLYSSGYADFNKMNLTVGINGLVELAELLGYKISNNSEYKNFILRLLSKVDSAVEEVKEKDKINIEMLPAESMGVKCAKWCKEAGVDTKRDCHNSYLYKVEDEDISPLDKIALHGKYFTHLMGGGSACHLNLETYPTKETLSKICTMLVQEGCNYFTTNILVTKCNSCGYINKQTENYCTKCNSADIVHCTRVIGYLRPISSFSEERQKEAYKRKYHKSFNAVL